MHQKAFLKPKLHTDTQPTGISQSEDEDKAEEESDRTDIDAEDPTFVPDPDDMEDDPSGHEDGSSSDPDNEFTTAFAKTKGAKFKKSLAKAIQKNKMKDRENPAKSKTDSLAVYVINSWFKRLGSNKTYTHIHMCWLYDRLFKTATCIKRDMLLLWNPFLPLIACNAFLDYHFRHSLEKKATKVEKIVLEANKAKCQLAVFRLLMKRTCSMVSTEILDIIEEEGMDTKQFIKCITNLDSRMGTDSLLNSDSIMCHRSPFVCLAYSRFGACLNETRVLDGKERTCGGRHLCLTHGCRNNRAHPTALCTNPETDNLGIKTHSFVKRNTRFALKRGPGTKKPKIKKEGK